jgi:hypothetical protein
MNAVEEAYDEMAAKIAESEPNLLALKRMDRERKLYNDLQILKTGKNLCITGINSTGPAHQGRESIFESLIMDSFGPFEESLRDENNVYLTVLNPREEIFFKRALHEGDRVGRILDEMKATFGILHDIIDNLEVRKKREGIEYGNLNMGLHTYPFCAIVIGYDIDGVNGFHKMQLNLYPEGQGVRGLTGKTFQLDTEDTPQLFYLGEAYFTELMNSSILVPVSDLKDFRRELNKISMKRYGI